MVSIDKSMRLTGHIKFIFDNKKSGFITVTLDNGEKDLYFIAKQVADNKFDSLNKGDKVTFTVGTNENNEIIFANNIQIVDKKEVANIIPMNKSRFTGFVSNILNDKKAGWITPDDGTDNIYFIAKEVENDDFVSLKNGNIVNFTIGEYKEGMKFANKITFHFKGFISTIFYDKKAGWITSDDENIKIYFLAKEVEEDGFESLHLGNIVTFTIRKYKESMSFANNIKFRFNGFIQSIFHDKKAGWITPEDGTGNIYFLAKEVEKNKFESLKKGDIVTFTVSKSTNNTKFANKITILESNYNSDAYLNSFKQNSLNTPITCKDFKTIITQQFNQVLQTQRSDEFENCVFLLLRSLGIHSLYQYDNKKQAGKADGFFIIGSLAVMYDCTLRPDFEEHKKDQIENYVNKLEQSQLTFDLRSDGARRTKTIKIAGKSKQVWIITKGKSREISDYGNIKVKEVSVNDIVSLLQIRLNLDIIEEDDLALNLLSCIEKFNLT